MEKKLNSNFQEGKIIVSKSDYIAGSTCRMATFLSLTKKEEAKPIDNEMILVNGQEFGRLAARFMKATYHVPHGIGMQEMVNATQRAIQEGHKVIEDASFVSGGKFCSVDIFQLNEDESVTFYEVKSASEVKEINYFDVAFQYAVLTELGYNVKNAYLMYANGKFTLPRPSETIKKSSSGQSKKMDDSLMEDECKNSDKSMTEEQIDISLNAEMEKYADLFAVEDMTERCKELVPIVKCDVEAVMDALSGDVPLKREFSKSCNSPYKCPFMDYCIKDEGMPEDSNVFKISGAKFFTKLNKWYLEGIETFQDLVDNVQVKYKKDGTPKDATWKYVQQAKSYLDKCDPPVDMEKLGEFLGQIEYPLASFDYEGFATAVPMYYGLKPSQQVVFQFSYDYVEYEGAERKHYDFLACPGTDTRAFVCRALAKLPKAKKILVWNKTYEASRNKEMAELEGFEEFKDMLLEMVDNFLDLMVPFRERVIAPWKANGSYSLKPITENFVPDLRYFDLKVHNGTEAAEKFLQLPKMSASDKKKCIHALKMYNNQDTYGPLKILEKMFRIYKGDDSYVLFTDENQNDILGNTLMVGDTITCNRGIGVITKFNKKYITIMLMLNGEEIRRLGKSVVRIQDIVGDKARNINVRAFGEKLEYNDLVSCDLGIGTVVGFTPCFVVVQLTNGKVLLRKSHNLNMLQSFVDD